MSDSAKTQGVASAPVREISSLPEDLPAASSAPVDAGTNVPAPSLQDHSGNAASPDLSGHVDSTMGHGEHEDLDELARFLESREKHPASPGVCTPHELSPGATFQATDDLPTTPRNIPSPSPALPQQPTASGVSPESPPRGSPLPSASGEIQSVSPDLQRSERGASNASDTHALYALSTTALPESPPNPAEIPTPSPVSRAATPTPPKRDDRSLPSEGGSSPASPSAGREASLGHVASIADQSEDVAAVAVEGGVEGGVEGDVDANTEAEAKSEAMEQDPTTPVPISPDDAEQAPATPGPIAPDDAEQALIQADPEALGEAPATPTLLTVETTEVASAQTDVADGDRQSSSAEPAREDTTELARVGRVLPPFTPYSPPLSPLSNEADESLNGDLTGDIDAPRSSDTPGPGDEVKEPRAKSPENGMLSGSLNHLKSETEALPGANEEQMVESPAADGQEQEVPGIAEGQEQEVPDISETQKLDGTESQELQGLATAEGHFVETRLPTSAPGVTVTQATVPPRKRGRPRKSVESVPKPVKLGKRRTPTVQVTTRRRNRGSNPATSTAPADPASPGISHSVDYEPNGKSLQGSSGLSKDAPDRSSPDAVGNPAESLFARDDSIEDSPDFAAPRHAEAPSKTTVKTEESTDFEIVGAPGPSRLHSQGVSFVAVKESTSQEASPNAEASSYDSQDEDSSDTASDTESENEEDAVPVSRKRRFTLGGLWRGRGARETASRAKRRRAAGSKGVSTRGRSREAVNYDEDSANGRVAETGTDVGESDKSSTEEELDAAAEQELAALTPEDITKLCDRTHRGRKSRVLNLLLKKGRITLSDIFRRCDVPTVAPTTDNWRNIAPRTKPPVEGGISSLHTEIEWSEDEYYSGESDRRRSIAEALPSPSGSLGDQSDQSGIQKPLPPPEQLKKPGFVFEMSPLPVPHSISYMAFVRKYRTWNKRRGSRTIPGKRQSMPNSPAKPTTSRRFRSLDMTYKQPVVIIALGRAKYFSRESSKRQTAR